MSALRARLVRRRPYPIDATLGCEPGELLAIAGPSGSGKSTMLRMIAGLERIEAGRVACGDALWADPARGRHLAPEHRAVGLVFQSYALFPHLDARNNVAAALGHLPRAERRARAEALLALVNLEGLGARRPGALSGGQRQRVALARALARVEAPGPGVLLLDEPFAAVDALTRERLHRELARLRHRLERPVLLVTHDLQEVLLLADRVCVVHRGTDLDTGSVERVTARPGSARVARLLGHRNLLPATVLGRDGDALELALGTGAARVRAPVPDGQDAMPAVAGVPATLLVPRSAIVLHRRDRPSRGERENPLDARVEELVRLGDEVSVRARLAAGPRLAFRLSRHVAERNALAGGVPVRLSLVARELHAMGAEAPDAREGEPG